MADFPPPDKVSFRLNPPNYPRLAGWLRWGCVLLFQIMATWWGWLGWRVWGSVERDPTLTGPVPAPAPSLSPSPAPVPTLTQEGCSGFGTGRLQCFGRKATGYYSWYWQEGNGHELGPVCYKIGLVL